MPKQLHSCFTVTVVFPLKRVLFSGLGQKEGRHNVTTIPLLYLMKTNEIIVRKQHNLKLLIWVLDVFCHSNLIILRKQLIKIANYQPYHSFSGREIMARNQNIKDIPGMQCFQAVFRYSTSHVYFLRIHTSL